MGKYKAYLLLSTIVLLIVVVFFSARLSLHAECILLRIYFAYFGWLFVVVQGGSGEGDEMIALESKLEAAGLPSEASRVAMRDLARLKKMQPSQPEYSVRAFVWLCGLFVCLRGGGEGSVTDGGTEGKSV